MSTLPNNDISRLPSLVDAFHESMPEKPRPYFGLSSIGHVCDRWLWLQFRWAVKEQFSGRMLRLFRRGQNEETTIVRDLACAGLDIWETGDHQRSIDAGCHLKGHPDGIIKGGVPEAPKKQHILECKTHNDSSFKKLQKDGVYKAKPMHYAQMQVYMRMTGIDRALYVATNKNDDTYYMERVRLDTAYADKLLARGWRLALEEHLPPPISTDPSWYECSYCPAKGFCHQTHLIRAVNCRTCAHATPCADETWTCARYGAVIPTDVQYEGCRAHVMHPDLVPWRLVEEKCPEWTACWDISGWVILNGEEGMATTEILEGLK